MISDYHAKYYAHELSRTGGDGEDFVHPFQVLVLLANTTVHAIHDDPP